MLKQVKRNKRLDWRSSRYSEPFKARAAMRQVSGMHITSQETAMISEIGQIFIW